MENYDYIKVKPYQTAVLDISEKDMWVLSFEKNHLKVNTFTRNLFAYFNGQNSLRDIVEQVNQEGQAVSEEELIGFVDNVLEKNNLIEGIKEKKQVKLTLTFKFPIVEARRLYPLLDLLSRFYQRKAVVCLLLCCTLIQIQMFLSGGLQFYELYKKGGEDALCVIVLFFIGTIIHELGHASGARYYQAEVGKMGVGLYLFMPVAYTDLSSIWSIHRKKRIVVNLGGFYFSIIYASIICMIGLQTGQSGFIIADVILLLTMLMNANPLLRMDGYWVLCDSFGIVNVNKKMYEMFEYFVKRICGKAAEFPFCSEIHHKKVYYIYFACFTICNLFTVVIGLAGAAAFFK